MRQSACSKGVEGMLRERKVRRNVAIARCDAAADTDAPCKLVKVKTARKEMLGSTPRGRQRAGTHEGAGSQAAVEGVRRGREQEGAEGRVVKAASRAWETVGTANRWKRTAACREPRRAASADVAKANSRPSFSASHPHAATEDVPS